MGGGNNKMRCWRGGEVEMGGGETKRSDVLPDNH